MRRSPVYRRRRTRRTMGTYAGANIGECRWLLVDDLALRRPERYRGMIETVVESIRVSLVTQARVVILKEVSGDRHLPIWIGSYEAEAIAMELQGVTASRPLPYDLIRTIIDDMGGT